MDSYRSDCLFAPHARMPPKCIRSPLDGFVSHAGTLWREKTAHGMTRALPKCFLRRKPAKKIWPIARLSKAFCNLQKSAACCMCEVCRDQRRIAHVFPQKKVERIGIAQELTLKCGSTVSIEVSQRSYGATTAPDFAAYGGAATDTATRYQSPPLRLRRLSRASLRCLVVSI
jgi:hypothetical protein